MQKIIVIGCPGSGKSTFSRLLKDKLNLPLYYLDMFFHKSDKSTYTKEEFDLKLNEVLNLDSWIIDGNYMRTLALRLEYADTVFFFDLPIEICLDGVNNRIGKKREDMPWVEEEFDEEFKQYIIDFPRDRVPIIYDLINEYKDTKNIIIFKSRKESDDYLNLL